MNHCPLIFNFTEKVEGDGFMADVKMRGRILWVKEGGEMWMYGVQPGGVAACGKGEGATYLEFRQTYLEFRRTLQGVLFDISIDSPDYNSFQRKIRRFFKEVSKPTEEEWWEAVREAREGRIKVEDMPILNADTEEPYIKVKKIGRPKAKHNVLDPLEPDIASALAA